MSTFIFIFDLFLISSDPLISSMRKLPVKKIQALPEEAKELIIITSSELQSEPGDSSSTDDDDEDFDYP